MEAEEIKAIRAKLGLTQEAFARKLGVAYFTVVRWENNMSKPSPLALKALQRLTKKEGEAKDK